MIHKCKFLQQKEAHDDEENKHSIAFENLLRFIASSDVPYYAVDNNFLRKSYQALDDSFDVPGKDKLSSEMVRLSKRIHNEMLNDIKGMSVSLLLDGIRRWGDDYQGLVIFSLSRLYLYGIVSTEDSTAKSMASAVASTVKELDDNNTNVIAVCCDNAKANIKALNGEDDSSQEMTESHFISQPCSAHISSLAIKDLFSKGKKYYFVVKSILFLLAPKILTIRSLLDYTNYFNKHYKLYLKTNEEDVLSNLEIVERFIGWNHL